jgi:UDP-N-acetylmuramoylalanine--D-glutamate ligase
VELKDRNVFVVGFGKTGQAVVRFLLGKGARVLFWDDRESRRLEASRAMGAEGLSIAGEPALPGGTDLVVPSPGVPPSHPILAGAVEKGVPVLSELELAFRFVDKPVVAVTGTNGKTTTTALLGELLSTGGRKAFVGGNIGTPLLEYVLNPGEETHVVAEVSSFQLQWIETFRPSAALLLNVTADHLDYHGTMEAYRAAKERIFENQGKHDLAVLNGDDPGTPGLAGRLAAEVQTFSSRGRVDRGIRLDGDALRTVGLSGGEDRYPLASIRLTGLHNLENVMAALLAARWCGATAEEMLPVLGEFRGLSHRVEFVASKGGVSFYDDSKGTNTGAVERALDALAGPVVLLLGGRDKGGDFGELAPRIREKVKLLVLFGEARKEIGGQLSGVASALEGKTLEEATLLAWRNAAAGDTVLLSPGCASFDEFSGYDERGRFFRSLVMRLQVGENGGKGILP